MSGKQIEYIIRIGTSDRYRHFHIQEKGKIMFFRIQYETRVNNIWYPVVRYDTAHGFAHRDMLNIKGEVRKTPLFNQDYNDALTFAESDLKSNWEYYKKRFLEEKDE
jgi:hypothetical protein